MKNSLMPFLATLVGGWLVFTLSLAVFTQSRDFYGPNPILRPRLEVKEPFQMQDPEGVVEGNLSPADVTDSRTSYALLKASDVELPRVLSSENCRKVDFATRLEQTGNYRQMTNNFEHANPSSCTSR